MALRPTRGMLTTPSKPAPETKSSVTPTSSASADRIRAMEEAEQTRLQATQEQYEARIAQERADRAAREEESGQKEYVYLFARDLDEGDERPLSGFSEVKTAVGTEGLRSLYNSKGQYENTFGSFENFATYMDEMHDLQQSNPDVYNWWETPNYEEWKNLNYSAQDIRQRGSTSNDQDLQDEYRRWKTTEHKSSFSSFNNDSAYQQLLQDYNVQTTTYNSDGDEYQWNGSFPVKMVETGVGEFGLRDAVKIAVAVAAGIATGGAASSALSATLGATGSAAVGAGLGSIVSQGITTGEINLKDALVAAATAGITSEFTQFLENSGALSSTEEAIARAEESMRIFVPGTERYREAQQQLEILRGSLEAVNAAGQGTEALLNLVGDAATVYDTVKTVEERMDEFVNENEDAAWQTPDTTGLFGDLQIQIRDFIGEREEEAGGGGAEAAPAVEEVDITTEDSVEAADSDLADTTQVIDPIGDDTEVGGMPWFVVRNGVVTIPDLEGGRVVATPREYEGYIGTDPQEGIYNDTGELIETEEEEATQLPQIVVPPVVPTLEPTLEPTVEPIVEPTETTAEGADQTGTEGTGDGTGTGDGEGEGEGEGDGDGDGDGDGEGLGRGGLLTGTVTKPVVREAEEFEPFLKGLSPFTPLQPLALRPRQQSTNAVTELNKIIGRSLFGKMI